MKPENNTNKMVVFSTPRQLGITLFTLLPIASIIIVLIKLTFGISAEVVISLESATVFAVVCTHYLSLLTNNKDIEIGENEIWHYVLIAMAFSFVSYVVGWAFVLPTDLPLLRSVMPFNPGIGLVVSLIVTTLSSVIALLNLREPLQFALRWVLGWLASRWPRGK